MSDDAIKRMLGMPIVDAPLAPEPPRERLDLSRCRTYAVSSEAEARGMFKHAYGIDATVCVHRPKFGWTVGMIPSEGDANGA